MQVHQIVKTITFEHLNIIKWPITL